MSVGSTISGFWEQCTAQVGGFGVCRGFGFRVLEGMIDIGDDLQEAAQLSEDPTLNPKQRAPARIVSLSENGLLIRSWLEA